MSDLDAPTSPGSWPVADEAIRRVFEQMFADGSWGRYHGPHCDQLRSALCEYHDVEHTILCSSGTSAVELALRSVPVHPGDEVVLAAYDFKANFINVLTVGAVPVLVDVVPNAPVIDLTQLAAACNERTRAIIVSHLHGSLAPVDLAVGFAAPRGIAVIEDACQNPGAMWKGRRAGTLGDIGVLSFGGSKLLTSGRGGALLTSNGAMAQRIRLYTQRGNDAYPLSEMQAAVLLPQLQQLDVRNTLRRRNCETLCDEISAEAMLQPALLPKLGTDTEISPAFYKLALLLSNTATPADRDVLCQQSRLAGIPLDPGFQALHLIHSQRRFRAVGELPQATSLHHRLTVLHHTALLQPEEGMHAMVHRLKEVLAGIRR